MKGSGREQWEYEMETPGVGVEDKKPSAWWAHVNTKTESAMTPAMKGQREPSYNDIDMEAPGRAQDNMDNDPSGWWGTYYRGKHEVRIC